MALCYNIDTSVINQMYRQNVEYINGHWSRTIINTIVFVKITFIGMPSSQSDNDDQVA